jgi:hypothetical protein
MTTNARELAELATAYAGGNGLSFRNRIINGDMRIAQRGTAAVTTNGAYTIDRWLVINTTDGAFSAQQDSSAPAGFTNSVKITTTTADGTLTAAQNVNFAQRIEGTNVADLGWGTASAKTVTLSFWVRSSLTGTFGGSLRNSAADRSYPFTYIISVADTWEQKSVTIAGDTSGTWLTTTGIGVLVTWGLGAGPDRVGTAGSWASANYIQPTGSVSVIGTLDATFFITGVQLEAGSVATPFERRPFGTELALCQRYYQRINQGAVAVGFNATTSRIDAVVPFQVAMRVAPSAIEQSGTASDYRVIYQATSSVCNSVPTFAGSTTTSTTYIRFNNPAVFTVGQAGILENTTAAGFIAWSAEL